MLILLLLLFVVSSQAHIEHEKATPALITALFVSFEDNDNAQLMTEAALLLSQHEFDCTLVLVEKANSVKHIPKSNAKLKVHRVQTNSSDDEKQCDMREPLPECQVRSHLRACEALLDDKVTMSTIKNPPRLLFLPGLLHDACILSAFAGVNTAAVVWSTGPISAAWLGHATNSVPFSPLRAPLQSSAESKLERFSSYWRWTKFLRQLENNYWWPATAIVASQTEKVQQSIDDAYLGVSLLMSASHTLIERPLPSLPMRVNVGCFHCRHARPIPPELQEWLVPRRSGLIVSTWPSKHETLLRATALALPQYAVLWLTDHVSSDPVLPSNLVLHDSCSLQDAIGHPRARLLLSECSETNVLEAVFHGVPVVCIPRTFDQQEPAQRAAHLGIGLLVNTHEEDVVNASKQVTTNASFRHAARHLGVMVRDEPETSADRLVFWAGHAARHWGHGHEEAHLTARQTPRDFTGLMDVGIIIGVCIGFMAATLSLILLRQVGGVWKSRVSRTKTE